jgi:hypothetical protein
MINETRDWSDRSTGVVVIRWLDDNSSGWLVSMFYVCVTMLLDDS